MILAPFERGDSGLSNGTKSIKFRCEFREMKWTDIWLSASLNAAFQRQKANLMADIAKQERLDFGASESEISAPQ